MMEVSHEIEVFKKIKRTFKINIEEVCFATHYIPKHVILDKTRNIHSYLAFGIIENDILTGTLFSISNNFIFDLIELVKIQYSSLDRPMFLILQNSLEKIIAIEGNIIREFLLDNDSIGVVKFIEDEAIPFELIAPRIRLEL